MGKVLEGKRFFNEKINRNGAEGVVFLWRLYYNVVKSGAKWFFVVESYREGVKVAEGDNELAFQVMMLGLATLLENVKNDDAPDTEIENLVLEEYHRAVTFLRKLSDDAEAAAERTGEGERAAQK